MRDDEFVEQTTSRCPVWCESAHDDDLAGARIHRGAPRAERLVARRMVRGPGDTTTAVDDSEFVARLVRYGDDEMTWIRVESAGGEPLEIRIEDANRWIMLIGSAIVDDGIRER